MHGPTSVGPIISHKIGGSAGSGFRAATDATGGRHLLIPTDDRQSVEPGGDSLHVGISTWQFDQAGPENFLDLTCRHPHLFAVFDELVVSILAEALDSSDPSARASDVIRRWRKLLAKGVSTELPHQRAMAVFAELIVFEALASAAVIPAQWWRGPLKEPKDIVTPRVWVEVKAAGHQSESVTIHGLEQLDDLRDRQGFLAVLVVEPDENGDSLTDVATRLRGRVDDTELFDDRLQTAGVGDGQGGRWSVVEMYLAPVQSCPRLAASVLLPQGTPQGIQRVQYDVELSRVRAHSLRNGMEVLKQMGEA